MYKHSSEKMAVLSIKTSQTVVSLFPIYSKFTKKCDKKATRNKTDVPIKKGNSWATTCSRKHINRQQEKILKIKKMIKYTQRRTARSLLDELRSVE